jgi:hypothetical protein
MPVVANEAACGYGAEDRHFVRVPGPRAPAPHLRRRRGRGGAADGLPERRAGAHSGRLGCPDALEIRVLYFGHLRQEGNKLTNGS